MNYGQFNYHKIMFTLDVFNSREEKSAYLRHLINELKRVITCFELPKPIQLINYADIDSSTSNVCVEFTDFIKLMVDKYSPSYSDRRMLSNDKLQSLVQKEIFEYKKFKSIVEGILKKVESVIDFNERPTVIENDEKINKSFSHEIRTARLPEHSSSENNTKIIWHGSSASLRKLFYLLSEENLMKDISLEKKLGFIEKFIVNKYGKKINI